jgi:hypothetical protein
MPADSFSWLTLFWLSAGDGGLKSDSANYLRLSYAFGPNEGWIALWRVRLALTVFAQLPTDLSTDAIEDFVKLLNTGLLFRETAEIFANVAPNVQSNILENLKMTNPITREIFARVLYEKGLAVNIPDTKTPGLRPWER